MTSHLSRDQLLKHLDGELSRFAARRATAHLQACWSCQVEFDRLKQHIALIFDAQAEAFGRSVPPPKPWPRIEPRLEQARVRSISLWEMLAKFMERSRMSLVYGGGTLALLLFGFLIWAPLAPVSAKETLTRAIATETGRQSITQKEVVRQRVRVRKTAYGATGERTAALESWKSVKSAYWNSGADPVNAELWERYNANGLTSALPLSPAAVEVWATLAGADPSASTEAQSIAVQVISNSAGQARGLKGVKFRIQTGNWHLDQITLSFADATFQISEEESSILDRKDVPNEVLKALEPEADTSPRTSGPATPATRALAAPALTGESTPVNLDDLEMSVRYTLHGMGADLGEGIEVAVSPPGQVMVNAAGASPERKKKLAALLGNTPGVRLEFHEPPASTLPGRPAPKVIAIPGADQSDKTPDARLAQFFGTPLAQENYARKVLQVSTGVLAHLYALRDLASRWPPEREGRLSKDGTATLTLILQDHLSELRGATSTLKKDLQLILKGETERLPTATGVGWQGASSSGLDAALRVDRALRSLLTISDAPLSLEQALPRLQQGSRDLELAVDGLAKSLE